MNQITNILIDILATALATAILCWIKSGISWISARCKSERVQLALQEFQTVLEDGVGYVEQTFVRIAKEGGTWDKAAQKEARQKPVAVSDKPAEPVKPAEPEEPAKPVAAPDTPPAGIDLSQFHSLDDILDYAYEQKSQKHPENAILAYKEALEKYQDDAYAPFIVIDLGNIYKEKAAYDEAIRTYEDALSLPIIANDAATLEKFHENLSYLRTVQHILSKHNSLRTPFQDIPAGYLKEIEAEFQARQKQS